MGIRGNPFPSRVEACICSTGKSSLSSAFLWPTAGAYADWWMDITRCKMKILSRWTRPNTIRWCCMNAHEYRTTQQSFFLCSSHFRSLCIEQGRINGGNCFNFDWIIFPPSFQAPSYLANGNGYGYDFSSPCKVLISFLHYDDCRSGKWWKICTLLWERGVIVAIFYLIPCL